MTYSTRTPTAPALAISALLAPQPSHTSPNDLLPSPSVAVLGPLPPTSALHLVLNYIALSDLPEYEYKYERGRGYKQPAADTPAGREGSGGGGHAETHAAGRKEKEPARALIITGNKDSLYHALQDEDEDWMREQGGGYGVMSRLKRCDIRYCSTPQQLTLLLALLTSERPVSGDDAVYNLSTPPGLVILYDIASLCMHWEGGDENVSANTEMEMDGMDGQKKRGGVEPHMVFNDHVTMSTYLDVISAARTTAQHLSHGPSPTQLVVLEPSISDTSTLPIMPKTSLKSLSSSSGQGGATAHATEIHRPGVPDDADRLALPSQSRSKRLTLIDGLSWMLGRGKIGVIRPDAGGDEGGEQSVEVRDCTRYTLDFPDSAEGARYAISKRRCVGGEWASRLDGGDAAGAIGGWRWEWMAG